MRRLSAVVITLLAASLLPWGRVPAESADWHLPSIVDAAPARQEPEQQYALEGIDALVVLDTGDLASMREAVTAIAHAGGRILHVFPPHVVIGSVPVDADQSLLDRPGVAGIYRAPVDPTVAAPYGQLAQIGVAAWNQALSSSATLGSHDTTADLPNIEGDMIVPPPSSTGETQLASGPVGVVPNDSASQYLIGSVAIGIILPESAGNDENWTPDRRDEVAGKIMEAANWWANREPRAGLTFFYDAHFSVPTNYEPIRLKGFPPGFPDYGQEDLWIRDVLTSMGYSGTDYMGMARQYVSDLRATFQTDWAFAVFVVDSLNESLNDGNGCFTNGRFAYAYPGGPFVVMTYNNDGYGFPNMPAVMAHEMGHIFWALDQYYSAMKECRKASGFLNVENQNSEYGSCLSNVSSIMRGQVPPYANSQVDYYARGQLGWWDEDPENGVLDPLDRGPTACVDRAQFTGDQQYPQGSVVQPGQSMDTWWRVRNDGTCTWSGYRLMFDSGEQMGGPSPVTIPTTAPGATVDIHVPMQAPGTPGQHRGNWRIVSPSGGWVDGGLLWISVTVPGDPEPPPTGGDIQIVNVEFPSVVSPGQSFRPRVTVKVNQGRLLQSRGDLLRNADGNLYGAWPHVAVVGTVNPGGTYTFEFYENDPMRAPQGEGTYSSLWRVWRDGTWAGPEITIRFDVRIGGGTRPDPPALVSPSNWYASGDGSTPSLCASAPGGLQYDFQIYESQSTPDSGWISSNCWTPPSLGPYTYKWHVKVKDPGTGLESDWSEDRHFSIDSQELTIAPLEFQPGSPSDADEVRVYTCVAGFGGIGLALKIEANTATDCSADGEWQWIEHLGAFCYNHSDPSSWPQWHTRAQPDGNHLVRATGFHNDDTIVTEACYQLGYRRPSDVIPISPLEGTWWNTRQITFRWEPSLRTDNYRLLVSINPDPTQSPILDTILGGEATEYIHTFDQDYETLYWKLVATNTKGSVEMEPRRFGIDRTPPDSSVEPLDPVQYEPNFTVAWQRSDDRAGIEWYDLQYRDSPRGEWTDWLTDVDLTVKMFNGQPGHTYCFRARALDNAGNLEAYPGGNGDTCAAVDVTAAPQTPWWSPNYASKRNIQILNNHTSALPVGYPVHLHFDAGTSPTAAELYASSISPNKGDDIRVVYDNSAELHRWMQNFSASAVDIWFNNQVAIGGLSDDQDSHQLYYGNASASNPPDDVGTIFHQPVDANTVGLWRFFEGSGTTLHDDTTYGNNGSFVGSPSWALDGKFGPYLSFPENNEVYVDCGNHSSLDVTSVTVEGWINFRRSSQNYGIVRKGEKFSSDNSWDMVRLSFRDQSGTGSWLLESSHFPLQQWHHFAFTYDQNTSTVRFYQDGSLTETWVSPNGMSGPLNSNTAHLRIGGAPVYLQQIRISNVARTDFSYGLFGQITIEPSVAAGAAQAPPGSGSADLVLQSLNAYPAGSGLEGGMIVQAILSNEGDRATENGFFTDLYSDHLPTGPGDYSGSVHFWIDNPIQPGAVVTVTTLLTDTQPLLSATRLGGSIVESSTTLYGQTDSSGSVTEPDDQNNISQGAEVCVASDDLYEPDNSPAEAQPMLGLQTHNINTLTDEDWVTFSAEAGKTYALATSNLGLGADTYLYLYDTDGATLLAANDDYGGTLASRIVWDCPATGTYYTAVKHWNPNVSGCGTTYDLSFGEQHTLFFPLALKRAELGSASGAPMQTVAPTATPTPVELATPTPSLTPTATDTATASPAPTITATVPVTETATPTSTPSPTEEQQPEPTSTSTATPTEIVVPTPTELPTPTTAQEQETPA